MSINNNYSFRFPAEWEPQSGVMLIWPHAETDWKPYLDDITTTYLQLADAITRYEKLLLVAQELPQVQQLIASRISEKQYQNIIFCSAENDDTWARDVAPITPVSYTHLRAHETRHDLVCRLLLEKKKTKHNKYTI